MKKRWIGIFAALLMLVQTGCASLPELRREKSEDLDSARIQLEELQREALTGERNVETGFILRENFTNNVLAMESWDIENLMFPNNSSTSIIQKNNTSLAGSMKKSFVSSEDLVAEFRILQIRSVASASIRLLGKKDGKQTDAVVLGIRDNNLVYTDGSGETKQVGKILNSAWVGIKFVCRSATGEVDLYVNGDRMAETTFTNAADALDGIFFGLDAETNGAFQLGTVYVHKGYSVNEMFLSNSTGSVFDPESDNAIGVTHRTYNQTTNLNDNLADAEKMFDGDEETFWAHDSSTDANTASVRITYGNIVPVNKFVICFRSAFNGIVDVTVNKSGSWGGWGERSKVLDLAAGESYEYILPAGETTNVTEFVVNFMRNKNDAASLADNVLEISSVSTFCTVDVVGVRNDFPQNGAWSRSGVGEDESERFGTVAVNEYYPYKPAAEFNVLKLSDEKTSGGVGAELAFCHTGAMRAEWKMNVESAGDVDYRIAADENNRLDVRSTVKDGKNWFVLDVTVGGVTESYEIYEFRLNSWYVVQLVFDAEKKTVRMNVNGWAPHADVSAKFGKQIEWKTLSVATSEKFVGNAYIDDIKIIEKPAETTIPDPKPADTGNTWLTMQACTLWREGSHIGWNSIDREDMYHRKPILGWYDEGNSEVANWEIKIASEHGVNNMMYCWYRSDSAAGPIMNSRLADQLWEGYFNSEFKDSMKFSMMFTNNAGFANAYGYRDLMDNLFPYFIETFFKNPNYSKTPDNKPVFYIYDARELYNQAGDINGDGRADDKDVKILLDDFRKMCVDAGFGGLYVATEYRGKNKSFVQELDACGYDYVFGYCWSPEDYNMTNDEVIAQVKDTINAQQTALDELDSHRMQVIPNISKSWDTRGWSDTGFSKPGKVYTFDLEHYRQLALWVKDVFKPASLGEGKNQINMVMLDNWNEYSEGHWLFPTYGTPAYKGGKYTYGYLDVLREVFGRGAFAHTDILPLEEGYGPYDSLYPNGWDEANDMFEEQFGDIARDDSVFETEIVDHVVGYNAVKGRTVFDPEIPANGILELTDAVRVVLDPEKVRGRAVEIRMQTGTVFLSAEETAKLSANRAVDIVFSQYLESSKIVQNLKRANLSMNRADAYRFEITQGGYDAQIEAEIFLKRSEGASGVAKVGDRTEKIAAELADGGFRFKTGSFSGLAQII